MSNNNMFLLKFKKWLKGQSQKQITLFEKSKYSITIKPFLLYQGLVVFLFIIAFFFINQSKIDSTKIIKTAFVKQNTTIVASGNPIKWTALVKKSDLTSNQYLLKLPKSAKNVKIKIIDGVVAGNILKEKPIQQLSLQQRSQFALANQSKSFFVASLLDGMSKFFLSSIEEGAQIAGDAFNKQIQETPEAVVVDLSEQIPEEEALSENPVTPEQSNEPAIAPETESVQEPEILPEETSITTSGVATTERADEPVVESEIPPAETPEQENINATVLDATIILAQNLLANAIVGIDHGNYMQSDKDALQLAVNSAITVRINAVSNQTNIDNANNTLKTAISMFEASVIATLDTAEEYVEVNYETPAPVITEQETDTGKLVTVSSEDENPAIPLFDILASTKIPEIYKVGQESKIQIKWTNNGDQNITFRAHDTNSNGKLDYVEWTVPHLSEQIFQIIFISKAFQLDSDQSIVADIYDQVETKDNVFASISAGQYIRYTFEQPLDNTRDNTIYAKPQNPNSNVQIEVYPVYTDTNGNQAEGPIIATFPVIDHEDTYRVMLSSLQTPTDVFDMKIMGGGVDMDYIVDPTPSGDPASELIEPANSSSIGNLQTIVGTSNATTQDTSTLFNYLRKMEQDRLNTAPSAVAEGSTDAGKLQDLLGASAVSQDRATVFNYIHLIYNSLANLVAGNIKSGATIGGLTGTHTGNFATGQVTSYATNDDGTYQTGTAMSYTANNDGTVTDNHSGLMWVQEPQKIIPGEALAGIATNQIQAARGDWATSTDYVLGDIVRDATGANATAMNISAVTTANPAVVTVDNLQGVVSGQSVLINGITWSSGSGLNGTIYYVLVNVTAKTLTLYSNASLSTTVNNTATYGSGGTAIQTKFYVCSTAHTSGTFTTDVASANWRETVWSASAANLTTPSTMGWLPTGGSADSVNNCENLTYAGYSDWRLPNVKELFNILVEAAGAITGVKSAGAPYINQIIFPNTVSYFYWSSTTYPNNTSNALYVYFLGGTAGGSTKTTAYYVRCVRGQ